jgi:hypothetical protein
MIPTCLWRRVFSHVTLHVRPRSRTFQSSFVQRGRTGLYCALFAAAIVPLSSSAQVSVLTYHNDNARTGQNLNETNLTPANVNADTFGLLFSYAVDGVSYGQPLYMAGVAITNRGTHNVVFVATEHDSVFAFDADSNAGSNAAPLWQASFINPAAGVTPVPAADVGVSNIYPEIGITSTPVIDPASMTLYVEAKTKEVRGAKTNYVHRLHALDLGSGQEKFGGPMEISPVVTGRGVGNNGAGKVPFNGQRQLNRPGLLLANGVVYVAYASHGDLPPYHGWVLGFNAQTLKPQGVFNSTPNGDSGGVWEGGDGPATDTNGNIYIITGNGTFDGTTNHDYADSYIKLTPNGNNLDVTDYFTPHNQQSLSSGDWDVGAAGLVVLPDSAGNAVYPHLAVGASKTGVVYLVDRDNLGGFNFLNDNQIVQTVPEAVSYCYSTPCFFNNTLYYICISDNLKAFSLSNALLATNPAAQSSTYFPTPGSTPSISANGTNDGIVWALQSASSAVLYAYNAANVAEELYDSQQAGSRDALGTAVKFAVPTVANGKVYAGTAAALSVFGAIAPYGAAPVLSSEIVAGNQIMLAWTASSLNYVLEFTTNLAQPVTWTAAPQVPVISGTQTTVSVPIGLTNTFYRLEAAP